jgi:hypothetical protein
VTCDHSPRKTETDVDDRASQAEALFWYSDAYDKAVVKPI